MLPPAEFTQPCDVTNKPLETVGDAVDAVTDTREQRDRCAAKVDALRAWTVKPSVP